MRARSIIPNSTQHPNLYYDKLMWLLTGEEWKVLSYLGRRTFGFHRDSTCSSVRQICDGNGRTGHDGQPVEYGTGLSKDAVLSALAFMIQVGIVVEVKPAAGRRAAEYSLCLEAGNIDWDALYDRRGVRETGNRTRTKKARDATQNLPVDNFLRPVGQDGTDILCPVEQDASEEFVSCSTGHNTEEETKKEETKREKKTSDGVPSEKKKQETFPGETWRAGVLSVRYSATNAERVGRYIERLAAHTDVAPPSGSSPDDLDVFNGEWVAPAWEVVLKSIALGVDAERTIGNLPANTGKLPSTADMFAALYAGPADDSVTDAGDSEDGPAWAWGDVNRLMPVYENLPY